MGIMDKLGDMFGDSEPGITDSIKPPSAVLRENGIDPSNLKFKFHQDGNVTVSGTSASQAECDRICELIKGIPSITGVENNIVVGAPEPQSEPEPEPEPEPEATIAADEAIVAEPGGRTYTVQSGDTLWAIASKMYGSGGKYMKIFEANTHILENPDKIKPGQELVIPDLDK